MATQPKAARILSKEKQKKSIKGPKKIKRNATKNTLVSPFALEWPSISSEHEEGVIVLLQKSCLGLKRLKSKPPWQEVKKYSGAERKAFLTEFQRQFQENLDPECLREVQEKEAALSHLILGYNAVMRALEKDHIAGIIVKKNVRPPFIAKTFLPGCANKCIPLIPLNDLDCLLKGDDSLALPHACMVLGLKPSVRDEKNRFNPLYVKMCEAVEINTDDSDEDNEDEEEMETKSNQDGSPTEDSKQKLSNRLSKEEIQSYHLKRTHTSKRAFVPGGKGQQKSVAVEFSSDFIALGPSKAEQGPDIEQRIKSKGKHNRGMKIKLHGNLEVTKPTKEVDLSSMFMIDEMGDESQMDVGSIDESSGTGNKESMTKNEHQKKRKKKKVESGSYVPAKTKRLKGNPNRKTNAKNTT